MQATETLRATRLLLSMAAIITMATLGIGCATGPSVERDEMFRANMQEATILLEEDAVAAAMAFQAIARSVRGERRTEALLAAAEAWLKARQPENAAIALEQAQPLPDGPFMQRGVLIAAEQDLLEHNPRQALLRLEREGPFGPQFRDRAAQLRGRALFQLGAILDATVLLDRYMQASTDPEARRTYGRLIWRGLSRAREPLSLENLPAGVSPAVRGWIALGRVGQSAWQDPYGFEQRLDAWASRFAGHPAEAHLLEEIHAEHQRRFAYPFHVALLLPLSGRHQGSAEAVRDGFLAGVYQHRAYRTAPRVTIHDTGSDPETAVQAAREAVRDGAGIIVGPLTKEALAAVNRADGIDIPILGLNYLDAIDMAHARPTLMQFGLLPEDEANQVAERSIAEGYNRGVALVPDNDFGLRMIAAFRARFEELGGELLTVQRYQPGQADYSTQIMRMLNLDESRLRHQQLRSIVGQTLEFEPRRRQDVDFIFLAATTDEARLIRPQLRFHQAINLPVYATSHVYRPGQPDRDLDGIRFADMPWMLAPDSVGRDIRDTVAQLWPGRFERTGRLYALGFDAFRLVPLVANADPALHNPLPAMTGLLSVDEYQRIRRDLYWARFAGGQPRLLPAVEKDPGAQGSVHAGPDSR